MRHETRQELEMQRLPSHYSCGYYDEARDLGRNQNIPHQGIKERNRRLKRMSKSILQLDKKDAAWGLA